MYAGNGSWWAVTLCVGLVLPPLLFAQQGSASPQKVLTPAPQAYQQSQAKKHSLQTQAKQVFDAEMVREKTGDCPDAHTTYDFNTCYGKQLAITDQNLKSYEGIIRELMAPAPEMPDVATNLPAHGMAGPSLSDEQLATEFERVEQSWRQYRELAGAAAKHQLEGGTGGPSFEMECELKLTREHMRELHMIYGEQLYQ